MSTLNIHPTTSPVIGLELEKPVVAAEQHTAPNSKPPIPPLDETATVEQEGLSTPIEVDETINEMNHYLSDMQRDLSFSIDEQLGETVIIVTDSETDEVIRQLPSEDLLVLRKKMDDMVGILFEEKV